MKSFDLPLTKLCRKAKVEISKINIEPMYGLFNGSRGTVVDIIFHKDQNPNNRQLPKCVIVEFEQYCGPIWDKDHPKQIPVFPVTRSCNSHCCERTQIPLSICFAKTTHTCQGLQFGKSSNKSVKFAASKAVVDVGNRRFEGNHPGTLYVALSRSNTIGAAGRESICPKKSLDSAFYFKPGKFPEGINNLTQKNDGTYYKKVAARKIWVDYLI